MPAIFISYRRSDSEGEAGRLSDLLTSRFSGQSVFMDVDSIQPGRDFRRAIEESIQACSVVLTLIGPGWLTAATPAGLRRLDAPNDYVRLEIAAALRRDIPVIPVLLRGTHMPQPDQLPHEIQELAYRNSVELTHARWKSDLQVLIDALEPLLHHAPPATASRPASPTPAPAAYLHAVSPATRHTPAETHTTRPGPSARRSAYLHPLPPSPFADSPTLYRAPARPHTPAATSIPPRAVSPAPAHLPPYTPPVITPLHPPAHSQTPVQAPARPPAAPVQHVELPSPKPEEKPFPAAALPDAAVDRIRKELAHFIGPIAEIVVRRAAKKAASEIELCAAVSHEIESATDRAKFLALCRK